MNTLTWRISSGATKSGAVPNALARTDPQLGLGMIYESAVFQGVRANATQCNPVQVPPAGLEPATDGLENRCSIRLSYGGLIMQTTVSKPLSIIR